MTDDTHDDDIIEALLVDEDDDVIDLTASDNNVVHIRREDIDVTIDDTLRHSDDGFGHSDDTLRHSEQSEEPLPEPENVVVHTFLDKRRESFRAQTRTKKQRIYISVSAVVILITLVVLALESPFYNVDKVSIVNTSATPLTQKETEEIQTITNSLKGEPTYRVDTSDAVEQVTDMPAISEVTVSKKWPGTLVFTVARRTPVAYIATDKGYVYVDSTGYVFEKMAAAPKGLPIFEGMEEVDLHKKISNENFLAVMKNAPEEIRGQIVRVTQGKDGSYDAILSDGITIKLGEPEELDKKLAIAWSIILTKKRSEIGYIDVSVPSLPVSGSPQLQL